MFKLSATALRRLAKLVQVGSTPAPPGHQYGSAYRMFDLQLKGKPIGHIAGLDSGRGMQINQVSIDPKFRGMGLGKKMYGDLLKQLGGKPLLSDNSVSPAAQRVWQSMSNRPGSYTVKTNPAARIVPNATALADRSTVQHFNNKLRESTPIWKRLLGLGPKYHTVPDGGERSSVFEAMLNRIGK